MQRQLEKRGYIYQAEQAIVFNNSVSNNSYGICLTSSSNNNITCNWVHDNNEVGFYLEAGSTGNTIQNNNIMTNGEPANISWHYNFFNHQSDDASAEYNYWGWGEDEKELIAESIYDYADDPPMGIVDFEPIRTGPAPCAPIPELPENLPPNSPTDLAQFKSNSATVIPVGATTDERTVLFKGTGSDPDGDKVKLQVELRRLDEYEGLFNETAGGFKESEFVESGNETTAYAYGLIDADYHWRARAVDEHGDVSVWFEFGNNDVSEVDFIVKFNNPPIANAGGPYHGDINEIIQFNGSGTDPDGDAIIGYAWDFDNDGITDSTVQNSTFSWSEAGMYHPTLKVQDARGKWSWLDSCEVNVYEEKPHIGPYPLSMYDRYYVHIFNIDDIGRAYVNGTLVTEVSFGADSNATDITDYLQSGNNEIRFTVENLKEGYTYGFEIIHADGIYHTIWPDSNGEVCGVVGVEGCNDNDQQTGIVYNKTIILELKERMFIPFTFVQLTDVHIGADPVKEIQLELLCQQAGIEPALQCLKERKAREESRKREYEESYERFTTTLNSISSLDPKPAFILVTGDHVEWNNDAFFVGFKAAISSFTTQNNIPFYFIPGNHDRRERIPILDPIFRTC
jgi:parallel beta-helix repeat protein